MITDNIDKLNTSLKHIKTQPMLVHPNAQLVKDVIVELIEQGLEEHKIHLKTECKKYVYGDSNYIDDQGKYVDITLRIEMEKHND